MAEKRASDWIEVFSEKRKRPYYYNLVTKESRWDKSSADVNKSSADVNTSSADFKLHPFVTELRTNPTIDLLEDGMEKYAKCANNRGNFIRLVFEYIPINHSIRVAVYIIQSILHKTGKNPSDALKLILYGRGHGGPDCIHSCDNTTMGNVANVTHMPIVAPGQYGYEFTFEEGQKLVSKLVEKRGEPLSRAEKEPSRERCINEYSQLCASNQRNLEIFRINEPIIKYETDALERIISNIYSRFNPDVDARLKMNALKSWCRRNQIECNLEEGMSISDAINAVKHELAKKDRLLWETQQRMKTQNCVIKSGTDTKSNMAKATSITRNMQLLSSCHQIFANIYGVFVVKPSFLADNPLYGRIIEIMLQEIMEIYKRRDADTSQNGFVINSLYKYEPGYKPNDDGMFYNLLRWFYRAIKKKTFTMNNMIDRYGRLDPSQLITKVGQLFEQDENDRIEIVYLVDCCRKEISPLDPSLLDDSQTYGGKGKCTRKRKRNTCKQPTRRQKLG